MTEKPFWETKTLAEMTKEEWESLCDGCALCCLQKLEDEETGEVYYTDLHCSYLDSKTHLCTVYEDRNKKVPECVWLTPEQAHQFHWLPRTCAYRLLAEGKPLYDWHPLISGRSESVHEAGISMRGQTIPDNSIPIDQWQDRIICKA